MAALYFSSGLLEKSVSSISVYVLGDKGPESCEVCGASPHHLVSLPQGRLPDALRCHPIQGKLGALLITHLHPAEVSVPVLFKHTLFLRLFPDCAFLQRGT